jgi:hypothetical protein
MTVAAHPHGQVTKKIRGSLDCCKGISNFQHPVTVSKKGPIAPDVPDVGSQFQVTSKYPPLQNVHWGVCTPSKYTSLSLGNTFPGEFILYQMTVWVKGVVRACPLASYFSSTVDVLKRDIRDSRYQTITIYHPSLILIFWHSC